MSYYEQPLIKDGCIIVPIKEIVVTYSMDREFGPIEASIENVTIEADIPKKIKKELESKLVWKLIEAEINFNDPDWEREIEAILIGETKIKPDKIRFNNL